MGLSPLSLFRLFQGGTNVVALAPPLSFYHWVVPDVCYHRTLENRLFWNGGGAVQSQRHLLRYANQGKTGGVYLIGEKVISQYF